MAKKITDEQGNTYKMKKPFYKKVWFWVLIVIVVGGIGGALGGEDEEQGTTKVESENTEQTSEVEADNEVEEIADEEFNVGDTVSADGYEITVNDVEFSDGSEFDVPDEGKQYVIVNITIDNNTGEKQPYNLWDFKLNADGNATDMTEITADLDIDQLESGELDDGATVSGDLLGQADTSGELKLQYQSNFWDDETVDINLN
ncbi:MAG: DUF4352 domain-containing protein [Lactococcus lactis]|nr:DUF4352 domain-containing protein [Lactococcus lactis]